MKAADVYEERASAKSRSANKDADNEEIMTRIQEAATPGPAHHALQPLIGEWKAEVKCWSDPKGEPEVSQGAATVRWKFGGRFVEEDFLGHMMGKSFTGRNLLGFDNTKKTFNSVWVSDSQTSMFTSEGKGTDYNSVITLKGKTSCAATGRTDVPMKTVFRILDSDQHVLEMYDEGKGANAKVMEIIYTRVGN
jgi:hypothetical protein